MVNEEKQLLIVEIYTLAHWEDDVVLGELCKVINETEPWFPDSNITLFYKMVSS